MVSIELGAEHGGVAAVAIAYCLVLTWMGIGVGRARKEYNVPYPTMYLERDHKHANMFNCVQRAHQNSLENQTTFNTLLVIAAIRSPTLAAVAGAAFVGGRVLYAMGYQTGDPKARYRGMVNVFGLLALLLLSAYSVAGLCGY